MYYNSQYGDGQGPILYTSIGCAGDEIRFSDCPKLDYFATTCSRGDVVGLLCIDSNTLSFKVVQYFVCVGCEEGDVKLVGGDGVSYGTVLVCIDEIWGVITDNGWDDNDAIVVCEQLGHLSESEYIIN